MNLNLVAAFLVLAVVSFASGPLPEARAKITFEQKFKNTPIVFEGTLLSTKEAPAPTHELYLFDSTTALEARFKVFKVWKGVVNKRAVLYSMLPAKAPCSGVTLEVGKNYVVWAALDTKKANVLYDFCGGFQSSEAPDMPSLRTKLDALMRQNR